MTLPLAAVNELALAVFGVVLLTTLAITYWASKRTRTATEFWAAGRGISGVQNGFAMAHDLWSNVVRKGKASEREEVRVGRVAAIGLGVAAILLSILGGEAFNVSLLIGLAFAVVASTNLPALVLALLWPRFNTTGAVAGIVGGLTVAVLFIIMSPDVWPGPPEDSPVQLSNPAIASIPAGFLCCWLVTLLGKERGETRSYHELHVRAETGLGSEGSVELAEPGPEPQTVGAGR